MRKTRALLIPVAALVAQTSTVDLSPIVGVLTSILPLILVIMVIVMLFKMIGSLFEGLGSAFRYTKLKHRASFARLAIVPLLVAETTTSAIDVGSSVELVSTLITTIVPVILIFVVLGFVLKLLGKVPDMIKV